MKLKKTPTEDNLQRNIVYALYALHTHYGIESMHQVIRHVVSLLPEPPDKPDDLAATLTKAWEAEFSKCKEFRNDGGICTQCVGYLRSLIFPADEEEV